MLSAEVKNTIEQVLAEQEKINGQLQWRPVGGGSINDCYRISSSKSGVTFFVKLNSASEFPGMFQAEAKGLEMIRTHSTFEIPEVITVEKEGNTAFLIIDWLEAGSRDKDFWQLFAVNLANMHRQSAQEFGLDHHNYIGSLIQRNTQLSSWAEFYITMRLEPQLRMAADKGLADITLIKSFDRLFGRLHDLFPVEQPSLLHGDLWSGNFMCTDSGDATIFDPAVYYGHREMDIAMSKLFGGFDREFYEHYQRTFPMENDWEQRIPLGQLYPLLVHVNLFGASYLAQLKSCLRPFV